MVAALSISFVALPPLLRPNRVRVTIAEDAPLAALVEVRTRAPSALRTIVTGLDGEDLVREYREPAVRREVHLLGLYPDRANRVVFEFIRLDGSVSRQVRTIRTKPLPELYPEIELSWFGREPRRGELLFMHLAAYDSEGEYKPLASAVDGHGRVRWYYDGEFGHLLRRISNGNMIIERDEGILEIDMLGRPQGEPLLLPHGLHHDAVELPNGNFLALSAAEGTVEDVVVEVDRATGEVVNRWDFREILDPDRPRQPINLDERDWLHINGVVYLPSEDSFIISGRDQSAVVKVSRKSGELRWILGNHQHWPEAFEPYLLDPVGKGFEWPWGQHAPAVHPEDPRRVLIYDNGNHRSYDDPVPAAENYSRGVEYLIDEAKMTVRQLWQYGKERGSELFTPFIGDVDYLPGGNRLVTFGGISRNLQGDPQPLFDLERMEVNNMKISAAIVEVTDDQPARLRMELNLRDDDNSNYAGYRVYRAEWMPLYPADPE